MVVDSCVSTPLGRTTVAVPLGTDCSLMDARAMVFSMHYTECRYVFLYHSMPIDTNECVEGSARCDQQCTNTIGSYTCSCNPGYRLASDRQTCNGEPKYTFLHAARYALPHAHFQILMNVVKAYLDVHRYVQILLEATTVLAQQAIFYQLVMIMDVKVST